MELLIFLSSLIAQPSSLSWRRAHASKWKLFFGRVFKKKKRFPSHTLVLLLLRLLLYSCLSISFPETWEGNELLGFMGSQKVHPFFRQNRP